MTDPYDPSQGDGDPVLPPSRFGAGYTVGGSPAAAPPPPPASQPSAFPDANPYPPPAEHLRYAEPVVQEAVSAAPLHYAEPVPAVPHYQPVYVNAVAVPHTNSMAIAALVGALVMAPLGIIFGHIALSQIKRTGEDGKGLAIAGLVIGYIFTSLLALWLLGVGLLFGSLAFAADAMSLQSV